MSPVWDGLLGALMGLGCGSGSVRDHQEQWHQLPATAEPTACRVSWCWEAGLLPGTCHTGPIPGQGRKWLMVGGWGCPGQSPLGPKQGSWHRQLVRGKGSPRAAPQVMASDFEAHGPHLSWVPEGKWKPQPSEAPSGPDLAVLGEKAHRRPAGCRPR